MKTVRLREVVIYPRSHIQAVLQLETQATPEGGGSWWDIAGRNFIVHFMEFNKLVFVFHTTACISFAKITLKLTLFFLKKK